MDRVLRATVVIDYQNVHLTAHDVFAEPGEERHETLIHPLHFANALLTERNSRQREGFPHAELQRVLVYRGQPSSEHEPVQFSRTDAQRARWSNADPRVQVHYRPLRYPIRRTGDYSTATGYATVMVGRPQEKGIDVLCALAMVREAGLEDVDLVVLASHDTDLEPSLDAALDLGTAVVETCQWWNPGVRRTKQLKPIGDGRRVWNTRLGASVFDRSRDRHVY